MDLNVGKNGGTFSYSYSMDDCAGDKNVTFAKTNAQSWYSITTASTSFTITVEANTTASERTGGIMPSVNGSQCTSKKINITQEQGSGPHTCDCSDVADIEIYPIPQEGLTAGSVMGTYSMTNNCSISNITITNSKTSATYNATASNGNITLNNAIGENTDTAITIFNISYTVNGNSCQTINASQEAAEMKCDCDSVDMFVTPMQLLFPLSGSERTLIASGDTHGCGILSAVTNDDLLVGRNPEIEVSEDNQRYYFYATVASGTTDYAASVNFYFKTNKDQQWQPCSYALLITRSSITINCSSLRVKSKSPLYFKDVGDYDEKIAISYVNGDDRSENYEYVIRPMGGSSDEYGTEADGYKIFYYGNPDDNLNLTRRALESAVHITANNTIEGNNTVGAYSIISSNWMQAGSSVLEKTVKIRYNCPGPMTGNERTGTTSINVTCNGEPYSSTNISYQIEEYKFRQLKQKNVSCCELIGLYTSFACGERVSCFDDYTQIECQSEEIEYSIYGCNNTSSYSYTDYFIKGTGNAEDTVIIASAPTYGGNYIWHQTLDNGLIPPFESMYYWYYGEQPSQSVEPCEWSQNIVEGPYTYKDNNVVSWRVVNFDSDTVDIEVTLDGPNTAETSTRDSYIYNLLIEGKDGTTGCPITTHVKVTQEKANAIDNTDYNDCTSISKLYGNQIYEECVYMGHNFGDTYNSNGSVQLLTYSNLGKKAYSASTNYISQLEYQFSALIYDASNNQFVQLPSDVIINYYSGSKSGYGVYSFIAVTGYSLIKNYLNDCYDCGYSFGSEVCGKYVNLIVYPSRIDASAVGGTICHPTPVLGDTKTYTLLKLFFEDDSIDCGCGGETPSETCNKYNMNFSPASDTGITVSHYDATHGAQIFLGTFNKNLPSSNFSVVAERQGDGLVASTNVDYSEGKIYATLTDNLTIDAQTNTTLNIRSLLDVDGSIQQCDWTHVTLILLGP